MYTYHNLQIKSYDLFVLNTFIEMGGGLLPKLLLFPLICGQLIHFENKLIDTYKLRSITYNLYGTIWWWWVGQLHRSHNDSLRLRRLYWTWHILLRQKQHWYKKNFKTMIINVIINTRRHGTSLSKKMMVQHYIVLKINHRKNVTVMTCK